MFLDEIKLSFGHNLQAGFKPTPMTDMDFLEKVIHNPQNKAIESFGLFSSPDYNQFFPDVKAEDLQPKAEDFIEPTYRALSEVIVHKDWNPIDFSQNGVLKKSMNLLKGQSVKADHEGGITTSLGAVKSVAWEEAYKAGDIMIPAGVNALMKIDGKSNPRIARGILMDPPSIHSTSVTVRFKWDKSHDLPDDKFWNTLGTYDKDGEMIRRLVREVMAYPELSLVDHGADPFAKKKGPDGKIIMPDIAARDYAKNSEVKKAAKFFFFDFKADLIENSAEHTIPENINDNDDQLNTEKNNTMTFLAQLAKHLGLPETATEAEVENKVKEILAAQSAATSEITSLRASAPDVTKLANLEATQKGIMDAEKAEVTGLLNKLYNNKPNEAFLNVINNSDYAALQALKKQYQIELENKYPASCRDCKSTNISRASASNDQEEQGEKAPVVKTAAQTAESLKAKHQTTVMTANTLHQSK